jgi:hypothetical protein
MSRKGLSVLLLILLVLVLAACRRANDNPALPTPVAGLPTAAATAIPVTTQATAVFATATVETPPQTSSPTPVQTAPPTIVPPTATATTAPPSPTPLTPTAVPPTAPPNTGPPPGGSARIVFGPGATSAVVQSNLVANGDTDTWVLRVQAGQVVTVQTIANPPGAINVQLGDMSGGVLASNPDTVGISAAVPATGDYQINFSTASGAPAVGYTAQIFIPAAGGPVTPTRIQFAPGASSAQLNDSLTAGGDLNPYVLTVGAGQTINVAVFASVPAVTNIYIRNSAGQLISSGTDMSGASATATAAGDYFIDVSNFNAAPAVTYTLTVTVPPLTQPPTQPAPGQPTRIEFGPGQTSAAFDGQVVAGGQPRQYVIRMLGGQSLLTNLNDNPVANVDITVTDAAGRVLNFGRAPTELGTRIPANGDFVITLSTASATPVTYSLTVIAPPLPTAGVATRIFFAAGSTTTTVSGDLPSGGSVDNWVIRAQAGQAMSLYLGASQPGWMMAYVYNPAGDIIALGSDMDVIAAPIGTTDDYYIVLVSDAGAGPITYSMVVEIP